MQTAGSRRRESIRLTRLSARQILLRCRPAAPIFHLSLRGAASPWPSISRVLFTEVARGLQVLLEQPHFSRSQSPSTKRSPGIKSATFPSSSTPFCHLTNSSDFH